jgi:hypothetical protein
MGQVTPPFRFQYSSEVVASMVIERQHTVNKKLILSHFVAAITGTLASGAQRIT